jgi:hypothetical protein
MDGGNSTCVKLHGGNSKRADNTGFRPALRPCAQSQSNGLGEPVTVAEQNIVELEEQLYTTVDAVERHRLLRLLIKEVVKFEKDVEFASTIERCIAKNNARFERQKELVARLKQDGRDVKGAYFLLVTLKTMAALFFHHHVLTRKILVCVVPRKG